MGLSGFTCPPHGEEPGRNNDIDYCVKRCSDPCVAPHVLASMIEMEHRNYHKGKRISVTMLTGGCTRKVFLERNLPFYMEPDRKIPTMRGSLIHELAEISRPQMESEGWTIEMGMELPCQTASGEWILTGTLDAYCPRLETIFDIKTLQEYAVMLMVTGKQKGTWSDHISDDYVLQANLYRYMAQQLGLFEAKRLRLQIITFGGTVLTGHNQHVKLKRGFKTTNEMYDVPDIPILDDGVIEEILETTGDRWYRIMYEGEKAAVCDEDHKWLCGFCPFNGSLQCPNPDLEREQLSV